mmetsp:Transcript_11649/g.38949  ORF Transcript_11649/g.38949 Transcript_11649/m.38949 type:complete len:323 (+) Transcript_11649:1946-2914(+)
MTDAATSARTRRAASPRKSAGLATRKVIDAFGSGPKRAQRPACQTRVPTPSTTRTGAGSSSRGLGKSSLVSFSNCALAVTIVFFPGFFFGSHIATRSESTLAHAAFAASSSAEPETRGSTGGVSSKLCAINAFGGGSASPAPVASVPRPQDSSTAASKASSQYSVPKRGSTNAARPGAARPSALGSENAASEAARPESSAAAGAVCAGLAFASAESAAWKPRRPAQPQTLPHTSASRHTSTVASSAASAAAAVLSRKLDERSSNRAFLASPSVSNIALAVASSRPRMQSELARRRCSRGKPRMGSSADANHSAVSDASDSDA